jgi:tetratricopeptide (TPR) repeat protein
MTRLLFILLFLAQRQPVDEAWDMLAKGDRARAAQVLQRIIASNPRDAEARLMLGSLLTEEGKPLEAVAQLEQAVKLRPRSPEAHHALGAAHKAAGNPKAAREQFEKAVALAPAFAPAQADLGELLLTAGESKPAAEHLDQAIRLFGKNPDAALPLYLRARIYTDNGEPAPAVALLEKAVALSADFAEAWSDLGQARKILLNDAGALTAFQRSVQSDPENAVSQYRLGAEYLRQGQPRMAVQHLRHSFRLNPRDQSTLYSLQSALRQDGQLEESKRIKEKLAEVLREIDRESQNAFNALRLNNEGAALEKTGDLPSALEKYRQAVALDPAHIGIRVNFAVASLRLGNWAQGIAELREALRRDPANAQIKAALDDALRQAPKGTVTP